jgi:hypothetical protein
MRWLLIFVLLIPSLVNAQQAVWTNARGATTSGYVTSTIFDADHRLLDIRCWAGCGGVATQDVNVTQLLGSAPSVTNTFPMRLSTGVAFYDARDRSWTLSSGTDSVTVTGSVTANDGTHTNTSATMNNDGACPSGAANFTVLSSNASRKKAYLAASAANTDDVFVKFGVTATSSDFRLAPGQPINEVPVNSFVYTGQIDAIPASGTQAVCVMEFN